LRQPQSRDTTNEFYLHSAIRQFEYYSGRLFFSHSFVLLKESQNQCESFACAALGVFLAETAGYDLPHPLLCLDDGKFLSPNRYVKPAVVMRSNFICFDRFFE